MPCFVANCAVVSSPRSASKATFALKSAEYRFRLPTIGFVLTKGRTKLKHLSEIGGPPQSSASCTGGSTGTSHAPLRQPPCGTLRGARVPPIDYRHKPPPEGSRLDADRGSFLDAD